MTGKIIWWDLRTADLEVARQFYGELLGWTFDPFEFGYVVTQDGRSIGMLSAAEADRPVATGTVLYAHVPDLTEATRLVKDLGGQVVVGPVEDNDGGHFVDILDPTGVRFGLWAALPAE